MSTYETQMRTLTALQAENAALKEQVAQLEFRNERLVADYAELQGLNENHAFNAKYFKAENKALQSKSAALVDALEAYPDFGEYFMENLEAIDMKKAALAEFKGAK